MGRSLYGRLAVARPVAVSAALAAAAVLALVACLLTPSELTPWESGEAALATQQVDVRQLLALPTLYLDYIDPTKAEKISWFSTVDVSGSDIATNFVVQRSQLGHLGVQQLPRAAASVFRKFGMHPSALEPWYGVAVFAVWNSAEGECVVVELGEGARHEVVEGEASGCRLELSIPWHRGRYSFMTALDRRHVGRAVVRAFYHDSEEVEQVYGGWRLIGGVEVPRDISSFSSGGFSSYIEQYQPVSPETSRMAKLGPILLEEGDCDTHSVDERAPCWRPVHEAVYSATEGIEPFAFTVGRVSRDRDEFEIGSMGYSLADASIPSGVRLKLEREEGEVRPHVLGDYLRLRREGGLPVGLREPGAIGEGAFTGSGWRGGLGGGFGGGFFDWGHWMQAPVQDQLLMLVFLVVFVVAVGYTCWNFLGCLWLGLAQCCCCCCCWPSASTAPPGYALVSQFEGDPTDPFGTFRYKGWYAEPPDEVPEPQNDDDDD